MRRTVTVIAAAALALGAFVSAGLPATAATRHPLGNEPSWVKAANRRGAVASSDSVPLRVVLQTRNAAAATAVADAVSNPKNASYRKYLTAAQYRARFAPTAASVDAVLEVAALTRSLRRLRARQPPVRLGGRYRRAGEQGVRRALLEVRGAGQGAARARLDRVGSRPSWRPRVAGVVGLDESVAAHHAEHDRRTRPEGAAVGRASATRRRARSTGPRSWPTDQPPLGGGYPDVLPVGAVRPARRRSCARPTASRMRSARGDDGHGVRVGIVDAYASPTIFADTHEYSARNDPTHVLQASQFSQVILPGVFKNRRRSCGRAGLVRRGDARRRGRPRDGTGREHRLRGRRSRATTTSSTSRSNKLVDDELVDLVSNSYGDLGEDISPDSVDGVRRDRQPGRGHGHRPLLLVRRLRRRVDEPRPQPETDFSASSNHVTAVGGTSLGVAADGKTVVEQGWSTTVVSQDPEGRRGPRRPPGDFLYGAGGGTSRLYREPGYQKGVVPDALAKAWSNHPGRVVPDISMVGDPNTGMLIGQTQTFSDGRLLRPVPDRRHEPLVAAVRGRDGRGRPGRGLLPRLRQPAAVQPVRHQGVQRREAGTEDGGRPSQLRQQRERRRRVRHVGPHLRRRGRHACTSPRATTT